MPDDRRARYQARHAERIRATSIARARADRAARADYVARYKLERGCADCGYADHSCALDLDHRDPASKVRDVAYLVSTRAAWPRLVAELEKCDVVCANCHRVRTYLGATPHAAHQRRADPRPDTSVVPVAEADLGRTGQQ